MISTGGHAQQVLRAQAPLLGLIGLISLIFLAQLVLGESWYQDAMVVPAEIVGSWNHVRSGEAGPSDLRVLGSLVSYAFLHADLEHLAFNMLLMWVFAALASELLGWRWMLGIFLLTAISGGLTHTALNHREFIPMLGASGAVMGFEGAYLGLAVRWRLPNPHVWPIARPIPPAHLALLAGIGVAFDYHAMMAGQNMGIAYGAHVGGFTMGLLLGALFAPRPSAAR